MLLSLPLVAPEEEVVEEAALALREEEILGMKEEVVVALRF